MIVTQRCCQQNTRGHLFTFFILERFFSLPIVSCGTKEMDRTSNNSGKLENKVLSLAVCFFYPQKYCVVSYFSLWRLARTTCFLPQIIKVQIDGGITMSGPADRGRKSLSMHSPCLETPVHVAKPLPKTTSVVLKIKNTTLVFPKAAAGECSGKLLNR